MKGVEVLASPKAFDVLEATIADIHAAYQTGELNTRQLVEMYLDRIDAYDQKGPEINALISINPRALAEADLLDAAGFVGPLHGIPVVIKDQADVKEMPTTMGSVLFENHFPERDSFVAARLKAAGAIFLGKATLGELGAGDTYGSLFGATRNVYDLERTVGGSSGGSGACVSANFCTVAVGQEGLASIRRPAAWNGIAGMRPTAGLVSRTGVYAGWPTINGSLGPLARSVTDMAKLLDAMIGYDTDDPITARGVGRVPASFADGFDGRALEGARLGVIRESVGIGSEPGSEDFDQITEVFDRAVGDLAGAGAEIVDDVVIPDLKPLMAKRVGSPDGSEQAFRHYLAGSANPPFASRAEVAASPLFARLTKHARDRWPTEDFSPEKLREHLEARETLMTNFLKVMADHRLDALVHKAVEHSPTLIKDGLNPPYTDQKGATAINTFLVFVPSAAVPAGVTRDGLPAGIAFLGRPYADGEIIRFAYAYEQATRHRRPPASTP
jgi:Asp-tRNA(Asn)/Glu-tRNA(Gln) amidotransferase A subunit family amidase